jgi:hypothetical protein
VVNKEHTNGTFCQHCGKIKNSAVSNGGTAVVAVQKTETEKTFLGTNFP